MNTEREARRDAKEFARAQMSYGEGAGNRRKLITATVESKAERDQAYARAFRSELSRQDMAEHASKARHERERKDAADAVKKNTKALVTGNYQNAQASVLVVVGVVYLLHRTGLDEVIINKTRSVYNDLKYRYKKRKIDKKIENIEKINKTYG